MIAKAHCTPSVTASNGARAGPIIALLGTIFAVVRLGFRDPQPLNEATTTPAEAAVAPEVATVAE